MKNPNSWFSEEKAGWDARQDFLRAIMELVTDMYNFKIENNFFGYRIAFKQCFLMTKFYIAKHFEDSDKDLFSFDDIKELESKVPAGESDYSINERTRTLYEIMVLLERKEERLYHLLSKENIFMPTHELQDLGESVFQTR